MMTRDFDTEAYLRKATSRAKSDVANKLISMLLHDISRRVAASAGLSVTDSSYASSVAAHFGTNCAYCGRMLEHDRAAVEHLEGMNRFRVGLHVPGNVVVACIRCNREKRRDDQIQTLMLASSGWESFLSHDGGRCPPGCKTCAYWRLLWPDSKEQEEKLRSAILRIQDFRRGYASSLEFSARAQPVIARKLEALYRECQEFASSRIKRVADELLGEMVSPCGDADAPKTE